MTEGLRALCAQCRKPLCGAVLASGCNHVFHKPCFVAGASCGHCGETLRSETSLSLYNLCCEEKSEYSAYAADVMAAAAKLRASLEGMEDADSAIFDPDFVVQESEGRGVHEVALLCLKRERINSKREELDSEQSKLHTSLETLEHQQRKLRVRQRMTEKLQEEQASEKNKIQRCNEDHEKMLAELNEVRQRATIVEYWDLVRNGQEDEALQKLTALISMISHPWKILAHMARLRDHYRKLSDNHDRERAQADRQLQHFNRERDELERTKKDLEGRQLRKRKLMG